MWFSHIAIDLVFVLDMVHITDIIYIYYSFSEVPGLHRCSKQTLHYYAFHVDGANFPEAYLWQ